MGCFPKAWRPAPIFCHLAYSIHIILHPRRPRGSLWGKRNCTMKVSKHGAFLLTRLTSPTRVPKDDNISALPVPKMKLFTLKYDILVVLLKIDNRELKPSNDYGDGNENDKKSNRFRLLKQQPCTRITLFSVHWKLPKCTFYKGRECKKKILIFLFLNLDTVV